MIKKICLIFQLLICCISTTIFAEDFSAQIMSDEVQKILITAGLKTNSTNLISPASGNFPYTISISFNENDISITDINDYRKNLIFVFGQKDFLQNSEQIVPFLNQLSEKTLNFPLTILFLPEGSSLLEKDNSVTSSDCFVERLPNPDATVALVIRFSDLSTPVIFAGSSKEVSPLWLVKLITDSFSKTNNDYLFPAGTFLSLYRFDLIRNDNFSDSFFAEGIPSASIVLPENTSCNSLLSTIIDDFDYTKTSEWDRHYVFMHFGSYTLILNETLILRCCLVTVLFALFILCGFSFFAGKHVLEYKRDIISLWYLLPLTVLLAFFSLRIGIFSATTIAKIFQLSPILQFCVQLEISFFAISFFYVFIILSRKNRTPYAYKFYVILSALLNIFIFSVLDISLFFLFVIEYALVLLTRPVRRVIPLFFVGLILLLPFIPYGIILWQYMDVQKLPSLIVGNFSSNIFLSLTILPFHLIWLTILSRFINKNDKTTILLTSLKTLAIIAVLAVIFFSCFSGISYLFKKYRFIPTLTELTENVTFRESKEKNLSVSVESISSFDNVFRTVFISSKKLPERYEIIISGNTTQPVYEASVPYIENTKTNSAIIRLPDFPPENCSFTYTTTSEEGEKIRIKVYYSTDDNQIFDVETIEYQTPESTKAEVYR